MDLSIVFTFAALIILGGLLFAFMGFAKRTTARLDVDKYRSKWLTIEHQLKRDDTHSYSMSVLNADKLVDQALKDRGAKGETMAERMKSSSALFKNRNAIWTAHKLRNQIAHEPDVRVTYDAARSALASFKQALKDIGAI